MIVSIHQPSYFSWLGLLDKIAKSDEFILLDEVQLSDSAYQHRNIFLTSQGKVKYLTLPANKKGYLSRSIGELELLNSNWQNDHQNFIRENYGRHPFFQEVFPNIDFIFNKRYELLIDVLKDSMSVLMAMLGIETKMLLQSEISGERQAKKNDLVLSLVKSVKADIYLSGRGAEAYLDPGMFEANMVKVVFNEFKHPKYSQRNTADRDFIEGLSGLDLLFNLGINGSKELFWNNVNNMQKEKSYANEG